MDLLDQPVTLVLIGIVFLFGGLGVLKLLRRSAENGHDPSARDQDRGSEQDENAS